LASSIHLLTLSDIISASNSAKAHNIFKNNLQFAEVVSILFSIKITSFHFSFKE
jgi:hypothetical protein